MQRLVVCCKMFNLRNSGVPSQLVITSDPFGKSSYEFVVSWEKPETGGMQIVEYEFRLRKVNCFCCFFDLLKYYVHDSCTTYHTDYRALLLTRGSYSRNFPDLTSQVVLISARLYCCHINVLTAIYFR